MQKTTVSSARNGGFRTKKQRFLKLILIFVYIKTIYYTDYQRFVCDIENKRFSSPNDYVPANIGYMYA